MFGQVKNQHLKTLKYVIIITNKKAGKTMSYIALYRAYRPKSFDEAVGQRVIIQTLKNAVMHHKIGHAYLFSGPRGTGKTSLAKIFAKAVNCLNPIEGNPCNTCSMCQGIDSNDIADVIEIDAASNNGVDEIRELRDKVKYMPSAGKYKVYIIDEVHMLTPGAFNALLKTLEEPPKHVIFILATTEVYKIPATILSRCQRFDYKNIDVEDMLEKLTEIVEKEKIKIDETAVLAIAESAEGGLRDAISLLDQTVSYAKEKITEEDVYQVSGHVSKRSLADILEALINKEIGQAMKILNELLNLGKEIPRIVNDLILSLRDILLEKTTVVEQPKFEKIANQVSIDKVYFFLEVLKQLQQDIKWTHQKRAYIELALIKMVEHQSIKTIDHEASILDLKQTVLELKKAIETRPAPQEKVQKQTKKTLVTVKDVEQILHNGDKDKKELLRNSWSHLANYPKKHLKMTAYLLSQAELEAISSKMLLVYDDLVLCKKIMDPDIKDEVLQIINSKNHLIDGYIAIQRSDWEILKEAYIKGFTKGEKKPKLPQIDLNLYLDENKQEEEPDHLRLAKEYFGVDKVTIKE